MKVLYDLEVFNRQDIGGISRYFYELIKYFELQKKIEIDFPKKASNNIYLNSLPAYQNAIQQSGFQKMSMLLLKAGKKFKSIPKQALPYLLWDYAFKRQYKSKIIKGNYDIFHATFYTDYYTKDIQKPLVVTIHDMIHEKFSNLSKYRNNSSTIEDKSKLIQRADRIIAVSEFTKQDIIKFHPSAATKISVVHHGNSFHQITEEKINNLPERYLLFVGGRKEYKNFEFFITAINDYIKSEKLKVICVGHPFSKEEHQILKQLNVDTFCNTIFATDGELKYLYKNASAFIFPSLMEGFGFPILEAFESSCPCILSNSTCFQEIAGDAALYFNPEDKDDLIRAIDSVLKNDTLKIKMIEQGKERLKQFTWEKTGKETLQVYDELMN